MSDLPTPETDAQPKSIEIGAGATYHTVSAEFARKLERQRDEAREELAAERALADRLAVSVDVLIVALNSFRDEPTPIGAKSLSAWKEARSE